MSTVVVWIAVGVEDLRQEEDNDAELESSAQLYEQLLNSSPNQLH